MKSNNSGIRWHRVFGVSSIVAVLIFAAMLYADFGASIRLAASTGKAAEDTSGAAANDVSSGNNTDTKKQGVSEKAVVCIDASHGGTDTGQYDGKNYEKDQMLELAKLIESNLSAYGISVVMTRTTDENVDYSARIKKSSEGKAVALVSLHRDVAKKNGTESGVSTWIHTSSPKDSNKLATDIIDAFKEIGVGTNGVNTGTPDDLSKDYYLNQHSSSASCIVELGNMYSSEDNKLVTTDKENTAKAVSDGIIKYLEQAGYING